MLNPQDRPVLAGRVDHRWTVADFARLADIGVLPFDRRFELIDGLVYELSPMGPLHAAALTTLNEFFAGRNARYVTRVQLPILLGDKTQPEPDIVLAYGPGYRYHREHPERRDILLIIEVAESSFDFDTGFKKRTYARWGISEYWVVDLPRRRVLRYLDPIGDDYGICEAVTSGTIAALTLPDMTFPILDLPEPEPAA